MSDLMTREATTALAASSLTIMATGDPADFRRLVAPDAVNREARHEPPACRVPGPDGFYATALWLREAFSDLTFAVDEVVWDDDLVVTHGTMSGRQTGGFSVWTPAGEVDRVFVPTGRSFTVNQAHFLRFRDGQVVEHWAVRDDQAMAMQLGWLPPTPLFLWRCAAATRRARRAAASGS